MKTATEDRIAHRYDQADLHDLRRAAERWWTLLETMEKNGGGGLSGPEQVLKEDCGSILSRIRQNGLGEYRVVDPQLRLWEEDAA